MQIDYETLFKKPLVDALWYLYRLRDRNSSLQHELLERAKAFYKNCPFAAKYYASYQPKIYIRTTINPILLTTALAISLLKKYDYKNYLDGFVNNKKMPEFDNDLITINDFKNDPHFLDILSMEKDCRETLTLIGIQQQLSFNNTTQLTFEDAYLSCWIAFNSFVRNERTYFSRIEILRWGHDYNDIVHHKMNLYMNQLNDINGRLNLLLEKCTEDCILNDLLNQKKVLSLQIERVQQLYYWNTHELLARQSEALFLQSCIKNKIWTEEAITSLSELLIPKNLIGKASLHGQNC